jgi:adenine C2-methylase RlmN of 23S rRNA A2503 and tRNA A37
MRCAFCLTGKMGIDRNLTAGEIGRQVRVLARELGMLDAVSTSSSWAWASRCTTTKRR